MKVTPLEINRYKIHRWVDLKKNKDIYGIDVIIDGNCYHVKEDKPLWFESKSDAIKHVKKLNRELRESKKLKIAL